MKSRRLEMMDCGMLGSAPAGEFDQELVYGKFFFVKSGLRPLAVGSKRCEGSLRVRVGIFKGETVRYQSQSILRSKRK